MPIVSKLLMTVLVGALLIVVPAPIAHAAGETWRVDSVDSFGCTEGDNTLNVSRAGLDPSADYHHRTLVTVDGVVYMNEDVRFAPGNGPGSWGLYHSTSGGPASDTWPLPADRHVWVDLTLADDGGAVLHRWTLVLESCSSGVVLYNDETGNDVDRDLFPNATDACPSVAAPDTVRGCPVFTRDVKLKGKRRKATGRVQCTGCSELASTQRVRVYYQGPRRFKKKIAKHTTTNQFGRFVIRKTTGSKRIYPGRYWVKVPAVLDPSVGEAGKMRTRKVRVR